MLHALLGATFHVHARVVRGAERLDRCRPGWAPEVNEDMIDMDSPFACPLGQTYGSYSRGCEALGLPDNHTACRHGFIGSLIGRFVAPLARLEERLLRDAWIAAIRERTERERPQAQSLLRLCGTDGASLANVANGTPLYCLVE